MADRTNYTYTPGYSGGASGYTPSGPRQVPQAQAKPKVSYQPSKARAPQRGGRPPVPPTTRPIKDLAMFAMILFVIPLVGIVGIFFKPFLWLFVVVAALCLAGMWVFRCFAQGSRVLFTVLLLVLAILSLVAVIDLSAAPTNYPVYGAAADGQTDENFWAQADNPTQPILAGVVSTSSPEAGGLPTVPPDQEDEPLGETVNNGLINPFAVAAATATPPLAVQTENEPDNQANVVLGSNALVTDAPPVNEAISGAQQALENYLKCWQSRDYEGMVNYTLPSWRNAQSGAAQQTLYWNHNFWLLKSWTMSTEATSPAADSATIKVTTNLAKSNNAQTPAIMDYQAIVINESGTWYVDPDSMSRGVAVTETPVPEYMADSIVPTPEPPQETISPSLKLWYNSKGGSYYHTQEKCSTIGESYYKNMKSFTFDELGKSPYSDLKPCDTCGAPAKP